VDEGSGAFEVAEELEAESGPVTGTLDETGDVSQHQRVATLQLGDTEVRMERRERVGGDLRLRARECRQQRRLATVGQPDEPDVGDEAQLEVQVTFLSGIAQLAGSGRLPGGGGEAGIAATAASPASRQRDGAGAVEVGEHRVPLANDRPHRDVQRHIRAVMAGALAPTARAPVLGAERSALAKARQRGVRRVGDDEHITAAPSVAPVRSAVGDVLLAAKADSSPPA
jgi:hypothetical protein